MKRKSGQELMLELIWWIFTAIVAAAIIYPISDKIHNYPFLVINVIFIIVFITFTRYLFLLKYTFLAHRRTLKALLIALCLPALFYLISELNIFYAFAGEEGLETFMLHLPLEQKETLKTYIRNEMVLFGTGSIIVGVLLPLRLLRSIWRNYNKGTV